VLVFENFDNYIKMSKNDQECARN